MILPFWYLFSLLPLRVHYVISDVLFAVIFYVLRYRRRKVWVNIVTSFPELEPEDHEAIERRFYRWFCDYLVETVKLLTMSRSEMRRRLEFKGTELVEQCISDSQSCAVYMGHYCNWEWGTSLPLWVTERAQCGQIYHPLENSGFDRLFLRLRQRFGAVCIPMESSLRHLVDYRRQQRPVVIGYIADQTPFWWNIHHWCTFLSHDTPVLTGTERIARRLDHAVFYLELTRKRRGYYQAEFKLITRTPQDMPEYAITDAYFTLLEQTIRRQPEFWLWTHDRWKRTRQRFERRFEVVDGTVREKTATKQE